MGAFGDVVTEVRKEKISLVACYGSSPHLATFCEPSCRWGLCHANADNECSFHELCTWGLKESNRVSINDHRASKRTSRRARLPKVHTSTRDCVFYCCLSLGNFCTCLTSDWELLILRWLPTVAFDIASL